MKLLIRADANNSIATGHIMRCISIAQAAIKEGNEVKFVVADLDAEVLLEKYDMSYICLHTTWNDMDGEIGEISEVIHDEKPDCVLVDSYYVTEKYLSKLRSLCKVAYIDDLNMFTYPVDIVINYGAFADKFDYEKQYRKLGMDTKFLLGCQYVPLRSQFQNVDYQIKENVTDVLITTGGTDNYNIAGKLATALLSSMKLRNIRFHIVVGAYNKNKNNLEELQRTNDNLVLHYNVAEMAKLMTSCDIAISAGGTTLYELCACGIPTIAVLFADNQLDNVVRLEQEGLLVYAGDVRRDIDSVLEKIVRLVENMMVDCIMRELLSERMKNKGVSNGTNRIVEKLL